MRQLDDPRMAACQADQLSQGRWDDDGAAASPTEAFAAEVRRNVSTIDFNWGSDSGA
jgi:hypothetical protein